MKTFKSVAMLSFAALLLAFYSCKDKEAQGTQPVANFAYKMKSDHTVIFTNNSEEAEMYEWDFGDGNSSTDESPTHKYAATKTKYTVTLTVTNGDFSDTYSSEIDLNKAPTVDIDGLFSDWDNVTATYDLPTDLQSMYGISHCKVTDDANYIYFYAELVKQVTGHLSLYFKFAENPTGTYNPWMYGNKPCEAFSQFTDLSSPEWTPEQDPELIAFTKHLGNAWPGDADRYNMVEAGSGLYDASGIKAITKKATFDGQTYDLVAIEISMKKSLIKNFPTTNLQVGFYMQDAAWADAGCCPGPADAVNNDYFTYNISTKTFE